MVVVSVVDVSAVVVSAVDVSEVDVSAVDVSAAASRGSFGSAASAMIDPSIAAVISTVTATKRPSRLPGKSGRHLGSRNDDASAKAMNTPATTAIPTLWPVARALSTRAR